MSRDVLKTYNESMSKIKKRFLDFGRKKGITDARSDLKILYKQLRDELNTDYAALMAAGLAELDQSQNELRTSALWYVKAGDSLAPEFKDETERLIAMEYYEDAIRNLKNAKSEQVASALLINTAEKLQNGISQQWINQFLHDPDLREKGRHQVVKYLSDAATIRNDDFVVGLLIQAACWMSNFSDAKSFIVKAKKISKTRDVQILELLFDMKHCQSPIPEPINWDEINFDEFDNLLESIQVVRSTPNNEEELIILLLDLSKFIQSKYIKCFLTDILLDLYTKITD